MMGDQTKECCEFMSNMLLLASEQSSFLKQCVKTLIQKLVDMKLKPHDFFDQLERRFRCPAPRGLVQLIKKELPFLRRALATKELSIDGIRPPTFDAVSSTINTTLAMQTQIQPVAVNATVQGVQQSSSTSEITLPEPVEEQLARPKPMTIPTTPVQMIGTNLSEDTQSVLKPTESPKEEFLSMGPLQQKIKSHMVKQGFGEPNDEVASVMSSAVQERLKYLIAKLDTIVEHRSVKFESDQRYEMTTNIDNQLKFLANVDKVEMKKHETLERPRLLKAVRGHSKDPKKIKVEEMLQAEKEKLKVSDVNATAPPTADVKTATLRDLQFLFESEKDLCKSTILYKSYLK